MCIVSKPWCFATFVIFHLSFFFPSEVFKILKGDRVMKMTEVTLAKQCNYYIHVIYLYLSLLWKGEMQSIAGFTIQP